MKRGTLVNYNNGDEILLALVFADAGDTKLDLIALGRSGLGWQQDVPRRDPSDYGLEGGGRTWHPLK
jgi:hypothetical protein